MPILTEIFYSSSNRDRWQLVQDDETGRYVVRHEPNLSSGGEVSELTVPVFLARSGTSPQATALRELLHKQGAAYGCRGMMLARSPCSSISRR
jgi:hypothetical protein